MCDSSKDCTARPFPPQVIQTSVAGTVPVTLQLCPACDFLKCRGCGNPVYDRTARKCKCGAPL